MNNTNIEKNNFRNIFAKGFALLTVFLTMLFPTFAVGKTVMFDLSHGQCRDIIPGYNSVPGFDTHMYILADYEKFARGAGADFKVNENSQLDEKNLDGIDVLIMLSPLNKKLTRNISESEKKAIADFIRKGGRLLVFVEEDHRVDLAKYGINDIVKQFGIEFGKDIVGLPGNSGAVSIPNEIFSRRLEIPYSGSRIVSGGIPASVSYEGGYVHGSYVKLENGGKLFAAGETMVGLLMGYPGGERNIHKKMKSRWWGKDSKQFMRELIEWALK